MSTHTLTVTVNLVPEPYSEAPAFHAAASGPDGSCSAIGRTPELAAAAAVADALYFWRCAEVRAAVDALPDDPGCAGCDAEHPRECVCGEQVGRPGGPRFAAVAAAPNPSELVCGFCGETPGAASRRPGALWETDFCESCGRTPDGEPVEASPNVPDDEPEAPDDPYAGREELRRLHESQR